MSLATRCTACGTIFRVVQDQLRVSEGWVRCGRCAEVFNAGEQLFDIDRDAPPPWPTSPAALLEAPDELTLPTPSEPERPDEPVETVRSDEHSAAVDDGLRHEPTWMAEAAPAAAAQVDRVQSGESQSRVSQGGMSESGGAPLESATPFEWAASPSPDLPSFMRTRNARTNWHRTPVRIALGLGMASMLALLGLQLTLHFHDAIAAVYPQSRPAMQALCRISGCNVSAWRRIDAVSVESSALTQASVASPSHQYKLTVSLHNKSGVEVAMPAVELSLLDGTGNVLLRRVLMPSHFQASKETAAPTALAAGTELALQALVDTGTQAVSGYSVEIFYP